jgi:hypothetical protein
MGGTRTVDEILERCGAAKLSYIVATRPHVEKALGGVLHPTPEKAFEAIDAMPPGEAAPFWVYEVLTYVGRDKVARR